MGLFGSKRDRPKAAQAEAPTAEVVRIDGDCPAWLPEAMRSVAVGEYTFLCHRCNAHPNIKWPAEGGAQASWEIHQGVHHGVGTFAGMPRHLETWEMVRTA